MSKRIKLFFHNNKPDPVERPVPKSFNFKTFNFKIPITNPIIKSKFSAFKSVPKRLGLKRGSVNVPHGQRNISEIINTFRKQKSAFTLINYGISKFIGTKITKKFGGNLEDNIQKTNLFISRIKKIQFEDKSKNSSSGISSSNNTITFDFKNYYDVLLFLVVIFVDYLHDLGNLDTLAKKLNFKGPRNVINIFKTWITVITWLSNTTKSKINEIISDSKSIRILEMLNVIFRNAKKPDEHRAKDELIKYMEEDRGKVPFVKVKINDNFYKFSGSAAADIVFDQTSKTSGPIFYSRVPEGHRTHIGLPTIADKGLTQPTNNFNDLVAKIYRGFNSEQVLNAVSKKYIFNTHSEFKITFTCDGNPVTEYKYFYNTNGNPMVKFSGLSESSVLSAKDLQKVNSSMAIYKTCGDLGLIIYAAAKNSISSTGDTASYVSCMLLTYLNSVKRLTPHKLFRSIFEDTTDTVIVNNDVNWVSGKKYSLKNSTNNNSTNNNKYHKLSFNRRPNKSIIIKPSLGNRINVRQINNKTILSQLIKQNLKHITTIQKYVRKRYTKTAV